MQFWKIILGEWINDQSICHIQRAGLLAVYFPVPFLSFSCFVWFHESFRRSILWAVGRCNKIPSVENLKLENWLLSRTDFQDVCRCVDERKRCMEKRSMWYEHMKLRKYRKMNESALANFALEELAQMAKFKVGVSKRLKTQLFSSNFHVSASQKCQVPSRVGAFQEKAEAKAYCRRLSRSCCLSCWRLCPCFFEVMPMKMKSCRRIAWSSGTEGQYDKATMSSWKSCCWPVRRRRSYSKSVIRYVTFWEMANKDGIIISRSQVWILAHEMICCLTNLIETSPCWMKLDSTIIKTSLTLCARERSDFCLKAQAYVVFVLFWHHLAGMFLSFIISTQCQRLKNREDSSKYCHCPMLQLPVWRGSCFFQRVCCVLRQPLDFVLSSFISTPLVLVQ